MTGYRWLTEPKRPEDLRETWRGVVWAVLGVVWIVSGTLALIAFSSRMRLFIDARWMAHLVFVLATVAFIVVMCIDWVRFKRATVRGMRVRRRRRFVIDINDL